MHRFKYRELAESIPVHGLDMTTLRNESLRAVVGAFLANFNRIIAFCRMPALLALSVQRYQIITDAAKAEVNEAIDPDASELDYDKLSPVASKAVDKITDRFMALPHEKINELFSNVGIELIERQLRKSSWTQDSMQAVLSSVIVESWTAFETLASDLWVTGIDNGSKELIDRLIESKQLQRPDEQITPAVVYRSEYDPRKQFGSWLLEVGKISFQKLDYIRTYYSEAFGKDIVKLFDETEGGYIFALSAFRNAFIHKSGKADRHFLKRVERFSEFRNIAIGESLPLDGAIVVKMRNAAIILGRDLVRFVDSSLTPPS